MRTALLTVLTLALTGCAGLPRDPQAAAATAAIPGAIVGGVIGAQSDETLAGAALGALLFGYQAFAMRMAEAEVEYWHREQAERERRIALGFQLSDREVWEAEQRAAEAEAQLDRAIAEREAAEARHDALWSARQREAEARAALRELLAR